MRCIDTVHQTAGTSVNRYRSKYRVATEYPHVDSSVQKTHTNWSHSVNTLLLLLFTILTFSSQMAHAHIESMTSTEIQVSNQRLDAVFTTPVSAAERLALDRSVVSQFSVANNANPCALTVGERSVGDAIDAQQIPFSAQCDAPLGTIKIDYSGLFDLDPAHQNVTHVMLGDQTQTLIFSQQNPVHQLDVGQWRLGNSPTLPSAGPSTPAHYFPIGVSQMLGGADHLFFILALLLIPLGKQKLLATLLTFAVAHSLSLALPFFDRISVSLPMVEILLAISVVYVALNNLIWIRSTDNGIGTAFTKRRLAATFLFGLIHGMAFSAHLNSMGTNGNDTGSLLYFNLGLEAGLIMAIALAYPIVLMAFRRFPTGRWAQLASLAIAAVGCLWFVERAIQLI